jgi:hypothetical protein
MTTPAAKKAAAKKAAARPDETIEKGRIVQVIGKATVKRKAKDD